eukprot:54122_1
MAALKHVFSPYVSRVSKTLTHPYHMTCLSNRIFSVPPTALTLDSNATGTSFANRHKQRDEEGNVILEVGDYTIYDKTFTADEINTFSKLTLNENALHDVNDPSKAQSAGFDGTVAQGMFSASVFSAAIGAYFPGAIAFDMSIQFRKPVYVDDHVHGIVTVKKVLARKKLVKSTVRGINQRNELCMTGSVTILIKDLYNEKRTKSKSK